MSVPDPALNDWVPLWNMGGATVADSQLPARLRAAAYPGNQVSDWNLAVTSGWYTGLDAANGPVTGLGWLLGQVTAFRDDYLRQEVWLMQQTPSLRYVRNKSGGTWEAWKTAAAVNEPWHYIGDAGEPAFSGGWVNYFGAYDRLRYRRMMDSTVAWAGLITSGSIHPSMIISSVPAAIRPPYSRRFPAITSTGIAAHLEVSNDGSMFVYPVPNLPASGFWLDLAPIRYSIEPA